MRRNRFNLLPPLLLALGLARAQAQDLKVGQKFPDLAECKLEGAVPIGWQDKVVLIDFWASWCGPCAKSFPTMDELQKSYGPRGLVIIAVNEDEKKGDMENFLREHHVSFSVIRDARQKLVEKTGISSMPSSFIIDKSGKVMFAHTGFRGSETKKEYEREIESLLK